jgi:hypothetical protein
VQFDEIQGHSPEPGVLCLPWEGFKFWIQGPNASVRKGLFVSVVNEIQQRLFLESAAFLHPGSIPAMITTRLLLGAVLLTLPLLVFAELSGDQFSGFQ